MITREQMSKIKVGDKLVMEMEVESVIVDEEGSYRINHLWYDPDGHGIGYRKKIRITQIIPAAFDWGTVNPGDAFMLTQRDEIVRYIGPVFGIDNAVWVETTKTSHAIQSLKSYLTRAPEHDRGAP